MRCLSARKTLKNDAGRVAFLFGLCQQYTRHLPAEKAKPKRRAVKLLGSCKYGIAVRCKDSQEKHTVLTVVETPSSSACGRTTGQKKNAATLPCGLS
jgi:hypothetical protein